MEQRLSESVLSLNSPAQSSYVTSPCACIYGTRAVRVYSTLMQRIIVCLWRCDAFPWPTFCNARNKTLPCVLFIPGHSLVTVSQAEHCCLSQMSWRHRLRCAARRHDRQGLPLRSIKAQQSIATFEKPDEYSYIRKSVSLRVISANRTHNHQPLHLTVVEVTI